MHGHMHNTTTNNSNTSNTKRRTPQAPSSPCHPSFCGLDNLGRRPELGGPREAGHASSSSSATTTSRKSCCAFRPASCIGWDRPFPLYLNTEMQIGAARGSPANGTVEQLQKLGRAIEAFAMKEEEEQRARMRVLEAGRLRPPRRRHASDHDLLQGDEERVGPWEKQELPAWSEVGSYFEPTSLPKDGLCSLIQRLAQHARTHTHTTALHHNRSPVRRATSGAALAATTADERATAHPPLGLNRPRRRSKARRPTWRPAS